MGYNMKKYIKTNGNKIIEVRQENINGYTEVEVPEELSDINILKDYIYKNGTLEKSKKLEDLRLLQREFYEIHDWLFQNDWKPNKIITGEWETTDQRWTDYLKERQEKRKRLDEIKKELEV